MGVVSTCGKGAGDELLEQIGGTEVVVGFHAQGGGEQGTGQEPIADAHTGCVRFAVGAGVDDAVAGAVKGEGTGGVVAGKAQFTIGGVLDEVKAMTGSGLIAAQKF